MKFTNELWRDLLSDLSASMNLTEDELKKIEDSSTAKLIAAIPFAADCTNPERYALANLSTYILAKVNRSVFDMKENESIQDRLSPINNFKDGKKEIIRKGMLLLELISLEDHYVDKVEDARLKKYNPVLAGKINYDKERDRLVNEIKSINSPEFNEIVDPDSGIKLFWK